MHQKRNKISKTWPIHRKGTKFVAIASHNSKKGIPLLFLIRNVLKIAETRKEVKYMTLNGLVKINNKIRKDESFPVQVFDVISFDKSKKGYRLEIVNKKFKLKEISGKELDKKIIKISNKKNIKKNIVQMNLEDGQNILSKEKFSVGDSIILNTKDNKIEKILQLKVGANIEIIGGKHAGKVGKLKEIIILERERRYNIKLKDREVALPLRAILVIE